MTTQENSAEFDLQGGVPYIVIPAMYAAGRAAKFTICCSAPEEFNFVAL